MNKISEKFLNVSHLPAYNLNTYHNYTYHRILIIYLFNCILTLQAKITYIRQARGIKKICYIVVAFVYFLRL